MSPRQPFAVKLHLAFGLAVLWQCVLGLNGYAALPKDSPARSVEGAVACEAEGTESGRAQLLPAVLDGLPDSAPARWDLGYVKYGSRWLRYDEAVRDASVDGDRAAYRIARDQYADTAAGQVELARWCQQKRLLPEARAHYTRVLDLDPDQLEARARLGFHRISGTWVSERGVTAAREQAKQAAAAMKHWQPKVIALARQLSGRSATLREAAADRVRQIRDPAAIPTLELVLSLASEQSARLVVETLASNTAYEASLALARHAVLSPWSQVRQAAAAQLKNRSPDDYVPTMLAALYTPIQSRAELQRAPRGRLSYRHVLYREGQEESQLAVVDTVYERISRPDGDGRETLGRAVGTAAVTARAREAAIVRRNALQRELNARILQVLSFTTGEELSGPEIAWRWWNDYNDVLVSGDKPTRQTYQSGTVAVADRAASGAGTTTVECLAAGTKLWTLDGPTRIENIQVGDQVLARNVETGELSYKPVLRTTIRPAAGPLIMLQTPEESICTSGGHLFWVSGRGWVRSRDLQRGDILHTANHIARLNATGQADAERTYNLVVADFHTYFVGDGLLLSHDNTAGEATNAMVPGYPAR